MHTQRQHLCRAFSGAVAVLVVGMLLLKHVPLRPLAHRLAASPGHGCTEQVCHCGEDCACSHCAHHGAERSEGASASEGISSSNDPTLRSCGGLSQGPLGAFVVAKSLVAPGPPAALAPPTAAVVPRLSASLVPQRLADEIFHPPKERIGYSLPDRSV